MLTLIKFDVAPLRNKAVYPFIVSTRKRNEVVGNLKWEAFAPVSIYNKIEKSNNSRLN